MTPDDSGVILERGGLIMMNLDSDRKQTGSDDIQLMKFSGASREDEELANTIRKVRRMRIALVILLIAGLLAGWLMGI